MPAGGTVIESSTLARLMRAVTFQGPGEVRVTEKPEPALEAPTDAVVRVELAAVCGSDLHILHGRVKVEPGFTIGHEYVGTVVASGDAVSRVRTNDRVTGCFCAVCGDCFYCRSGDFHRCERGQTFGHGATLGNLEGTQAELVRVPHADVVLRPVPEGMPDEVAIFAGDVMGTGYHAVHSAGLAAGETCAVLGLGPVGLCAVQAARAAGATHVIAVDTVAERLEMGRFGAVAVHLVDGDPKAAAREVTEGRGADVVVDAVGDPRALDLALRLVRPAGRVSATGVYAERAEVHMGLLWIKAITLYSGQANVVAHMDRVLGLLADGSLDPRPLVTHRLGLDDAVEAYALADRREALKAVLIP